MNRKILGRCIIGIAGLFTAAIVLVSFSGCASWNRSFKNWESNLGNGLHRTVTVYDAVGNKLAEYEGKFDVDFRDGRVLFDDEQGKRHVVYFNSGTVVVDEK